MCILRVFSQEISRRLLSVQTFGAVNLLLQTLTSKKYHHSTLYQQRVNKTCDNRNVTRYSIIHDSSSTIANDAGNHENMNNDTPESTAANDDNMFQNQTTRSEGMWLMLHHGFKISNSLKGTKRIIDYFFKPRVNGVQDNESPPQPDGDNKKQDVHDTQPSDQQDVNANHVNEPPQKDVHNSKAVNLDSLIRDPGTRPSILSYPSDQQDEIRRDFQEVRFKRFWWLEYSETKDAAYCLPCYLFNKKPVGRVGSDRFTKQGFNKWKKGPRLLKKVMLLIALNTCCHLISLLLCIMKEIMEITDKLCQALQHRLQDIVNALALVSTTKMLLQKLRDEGWDSLMGKVTIACENNNIPIPDMNATYRNLIQSRKKNNVTVEHHYRVDVFYSAIDRQLVELNSRFNESFSALLLL
ncbi:zinc finger MYM-type protein 1 [Tanacetum coccineum]